jgi:thiamine pyridinylase
MQMTRKGELGEAYRPPAPESSDDQTLNVALYPYVPSPGSFVAAVELLWEMKRTGYTLNWSFYDCYHEEPPETLDVFAFDCIYVDDLVAAKQVETLQATDISELGDILPFAFANAAINPAQGKFAGIPYLGCMSVLYYRAGDGPFANSPPMSIEAVNKILGKATFQGPEPPENEGFLIDLGGKTTDACLYASRWRNQNNAWWPKPFPTPLPPQLEAKSMEGLGRYAEMAGEGQALYQDPGFARTLWFEEGKGRAMAGLTETMSGWSPKELATLRFCPLPMSLESEGRKVMCYSDAIGLRPGLGQKRAPAVWLANLIASKEVARLACMFDGHHAQYLTPTRTSILNFLKTMPQIGPKYQEIGQILTGGEYEPVPFRLGQGVRKWAKPAGEAIIGDLFQKEQKEVEAIVARPPRHHGFERTPAGLWRRER